MNQIESYLLERQITSLEFPRLLDYQKIVNFANLKHEHLRKFLRTNHNSQVFSNCTHLEKINNQYLLNGLNNGDIELYDVLEESVQLIGQLKSPQISSLTSINWWPFDNGIFVTGSFDKSIKIYDTNEMKLIHEYKNESMVPQMLYDANLNNNQKGQIYSLEFSRVLKHGLLGIASKGNNYIKLLDIRSMTMANYLFDGENREMASGYCIKWHPLKENLIASGLSNGEIKVWDLRKSNNCIYKTQDLSYKGINGICWDLKGEKIITIDLNSRIKCFSLKTKKSNRLFRNQSFKNDFVKTVNPIILIEDEFLYPSNNQLIYFNLRNNNFKKFEVNLLKDFKYNWIEKNDRNQELYLSNNQNIEIWGQEF